MSNVLDYFNNDKYKYYLHGTGRCGNKGTVPSIFQNGLIAYVSNSENGGYDLTGTAKVAPSNPEELMELLNNYTHLESETIVVLALPKEYIFDANDPYLGSIKEGAYFEYRSFCIDEVEKETCEINGIEYPNRLVLMPEFVVGAYNADEGTFVENEGFFGFQDESIQEEIISRVRYNYNQLQQTFGSESEQMETNSIFGEDWD